jgi:hypothetical protein
MKGKQKRNRVLPIGVKSEFFRVRWGRKIPSGFSPRHCVVSTPLTARMEGIVYPLRCFGGDFPNESAVGVMVDNG